MKKAILIILLGIAILAVIITVFSTLPSGTPYGQKTASHSAAPAAAAPTPSASSPSLPPSDRPLSLGTAVEITQGGQNAAGVNVTAVRVTTQPGDQYGSQPSNGYYLIVHVRALALPNFHGGFDINPLDFYARVAGQHFDEGDGNSFDALALGQNEMDATTLGAGEFTKGVIVFDVPRPHGQIIYAPNLDGQPLASWRF